jgi:hypothetical protein
MWLRSSRVVRNGKYKRAKRLDRGNLLYRSEEGVQVRTRRLNKGFRQEYIFGFSFIAAVVILGLFFQDILFLFLSMVGVLQLIDAFFSGNEVRRNCPIVEVYEMGVHDRTIHWPWQFSFFWPFNEIRDIKHEEESITLKGKSKLTFLIIYRGELGEEGWDLIEKGRSGQLGLDAAKEPPELRVYTDGGMIDRNGF